MFLSFEQTPPFSVPLRFFLTAPLFLTLFGLLLALYGAEALQARWSPATLALCHLITAGFMLQTMIGALFQIFPIVAGKNLARPQFSARWTHWLLTLAALSLVWGLLTGDSPALYLAVLFFFQGGVIFLWAAIRASFQVAQVNETVRGLRLALTALTITLLLGMTLALSRTSIGTSWALPRFELIDLHVGWGLSGWGLILLSTVGYVVVPMFQLTPAFPARVRRHFGTLLCILLILPSMALVLGNRMFTPFLWIALLTVDGAFVGLLLKTLYRTRRPKRDTTQHYWLCGAYSALAALILLIAAQLDTGLAEKNWFPLAVGILILIGGFMSVISGMLYKIVPFLAWLHLQNRATTSPPVNINSLTRENRLRHQFRAHIATLIALEASLAIPVISHLAGALFTLSAVLLWINLANTVAIYKKHCRITNAT